MQTAAENIQTSLNKIKAWADKWNIDINTEKTYYQYFTNKPQTHLPLIKYGSKVIRYEKNVKFLGLILDSPRLNWDPQIKELIKNCNSRLNLLKAVSAKTWGADKDTLLHLYKATVRSKIEYGCIAYSSASKTNLKKLEVIQNTAIRIATGCLKSTPVEALRCETTIPPIVDRIEELSLRYFIRARFLNHENPIQAEILLKTNELNNLAFQGNKSPAINRATYTVGKYELPFMDIPPIEVVPPVPPWSNSFINIETELIIKTNKNMPDKILREIAKNTLTKRYNNHLEIYTDGSRSMIQNEYRVAAGIYIPAYELCISYRLENIHSIMTAELFAIYKALVWMEGNLPPSKTVILSDSKAAIQTLESENTENNLLYNCSNITKQLTENNFDITIQWIPSHVGIKGNEAADKIAKQAVLLPNITTLSPCYKDIQVLINKRKYILLQERWQTIKSSFFLGNNKVNWEVRTYDNKTDRKTEVTITRLRVGTTLLNKHAHKINISDTPNCIYCNTEETIDHFLLQCPRYYSTRTNLKTELNKIKHTLGNNISVPLLLGGGNFDDNVKNKIHKCLIKFIKETGRKI